ncbi:hypothetical protein [Streptomyces cavernicola]|uniref:Uncharacterized protein n=1 Tax=Streptomyces cavernicola TaxID=3043613 RepID=A0ABT6SKY9_9ACTN|nr:hypothetical protein [Streptomyces sp. B-S-A6]MDI3408852.1 hypothetical protein [Streptomyces sp. B-S-A6]
MTADMKVYPLVQGCGSRFTVGLLHDVRTVLEDHGYPEISNGLDLLDLQMALYGFLYGNGERRAGE